MADYRRAKPVFGNWWKNARNWARPPRGRVRVGGARRQEAMVEILRTGLGTGIAYEHLSDFERF